VRVNKMAIHILYSVPKAGRVSFGTPGAIESVTKGAAFAPEALRRAGQSCKTTLRREACTLRPPLYSMNPNFLNLFMKKFTRERVVPTISASIS